MNGLSDLSLTSLPCYPLGLLFVKTTLALDTYHSELLSSSTEGTMLSNQASRRRFKNRYSRFYSSRSSFPPLNGIPWLTLCFQTLSAVPRVVVRHIQKAQRVHSRSFDLKRPSLAGGCESL
ncbi:hypothetical protein FA15DRAFT_170977 [Coprinopsis marcescibilis]|uniref:Uncharacterized protein n=1 Tax=Coprinopsis marcescibilis TaxID=230819 RepID=A0A5C3L4A0_COPMA|nr:hypothetical protein FA15DRAFT_170977 [Coprinopsis marcescibilis]